ncbi:MAG: AfsR/SARP family transcriptional regulator [Streptosporangiaceae bacterium]
MLGLLALRGDSAVQPEEISELIWCDQPPQTSATIIQVLISSLRRILGASGDEPWPQTIAWTGNGYRLAAAVLSEGPATRASSPSASASAFSHSGASWPVRSASTASASLTRSLTSCCLAAGSSQSIASLLGLP